MSMPIETVVNLFSGLVFTVIGLSAAFAIFFLLVVSISDVRTLIWLKLTRGHPNLYIDGKRVRIVGSDRKLKPAAIIKSEPDGEGFVEQPDSEIFFRGFGPGYAFNSLYTATMNISAPQSKDEKNPHGVISRINPRIIPNIITTTRAWTKKERDEYWEKKLRGMGGKKGGAAVLLVIGVIIVVVAVVVMAMSGGGGGGQLNLPFLPQM